MRSVDLSVPDPVLVVLVGVAGCGKSTFAAEHFRPTQVLSSDVFRTLVSDDATDQDASADAFTLLRAALDRRLRRRLTTVIDATNLTRRTRRPYLLRANRYEVAAVAIVFDVAFDVCVQRDEQRTDRHVGRDVLERQHDLLARNPPTVDEGFAAVIRA